MDKQGQRHEFKVMISGIELSDEVVGAVNAAIQKAAIAELGRLDLGGDFRVRFPGGIRRPEWWGLWFEPVRPDQLKIAGFETPEEFGGPGF
jgi:hypothetical protein